MREGKEIEVKERKFDYEEEEKLESRISKLNRIYKKQGMKKR